MKPHPSIFEEGLRRAGVTAQRGGDGGGQRAARHRRARSRSACAASWSRDPGCRKGRRRSSGDPVAARAAGPAVIIRAAHDDRGVPAGGRAREGRLGLHRRRGRRAAAGADRVGRSAAASCSARSTTAGVMKGFVYSIPR